jgi:hypothetical protein
VKARHLGFAALIAVAGLSRAQTLKEEGRLYDKPSGVAQGAAIAAGTSAKVLERQGFWIRVEAAGRNGWINASGLSFSSGSGGPTAIDTGRLGTGNIVSTSATRGLSAQDLLNGSPRMDEVAKMALYAPDKAAIEAFASQGRVIARGQPVSLRATEVTAAKPGSAQTNGQRESSDGPSKSTPKKAADEW